MHVMRNLVRRSGVAITGAVLLVAAACSSDSSDSADGSGGAAGAPDDTDTPYPDADWARGDAAEAGFDPAVLDELAAEAEAAGSNCLIVIRHGELVAEWYWNGTEPTTNQEVFSATKSYSSTLVGIAQADGDLDVTDPASQYIPEWVGTPSEDITVENLVSNNSGRQWSLPIDYSQLIQAPDRTGFAVGLGQDAPPGESWAYNNSAIQTLDAVLEAATGEDPLAFARERLLDPIGMDDSEWTPDNAGNANMFFGLHSTCEDMARFGYLFLHGGNWDGEQIVPEEWVDAATGEPSQELNAAYGYLWWLNHRGPIGGALQATTAEGGAEDPDGYLVEGAPEDMFWALGLGGQVIQVDPGSDTIVVRLGPGATEERYGAAETSKVVTEALVEP